jgi:hypothetical protein
MYTSDNGINYSLMYNYSVAAVMNYRLHTQSCNYAACRLCYCCCGSHISYILQPTSQYRTTLNSSLRTAVPYLLAGSKCRSDNG